MPGNTNATAKIPRMLILKQGLESQGWVYGKRRSPVPPWEWRRGQRQASSVPVAGKGFTCGSKQYCKEMASCSEAKFYLKECESLGWQ